MSFFHKLLNITPNFKVHFSIERNEDNEKYRLPYFDEQIPIFLMQDIIKGEIEITFTENKRTVIHDGIYISIIGEFYNTRSNNSDQFFTQTTTLSNSGTINDNSRIQFVLDPIRSNIPSYYGTSYDCRYFLEVRINSFTFTAPFYYLTFLLPPPLEEIQQNSNFLMSEIGIKGILKICIVIKNFSIDISDTIYGIVHFRTVKLKIVEAFFQIQRIETYHNTFSSSKLKSNVFTYQILDGIPCRGDQIPIRIFMPGTGAWPYPKESKSNLNVEYIVRLLLIDENGKHYCSVIGDCIYRKKIKSSIATQ